MNATKSLARLCLLATIFAVPATVQAQAPTLPKPSAEHKILASDEGAWDATIKAYLAGPDAEPEISKGSEVNTVVAGGFWVMSKFEGSFGGANYEGRGQFGYDPSKKKYIGTWIDSMSPALTVLEGTYDEKTKTMTYQGDGIDPATKAKFTQKMVSRTKDDGTRTFALYMTFAGAPEVKFMEVDYTKKK